MSANVKIDTCTPVHMFVGFWWGGGFPKIDPPRLLLHPAAMPMGEVGGSILLAVR